MKVFFGKRNLQKIFENLYSLSLKGMNYGNGGNFKVSGELAALNYIKNYFTISETIVLFDVGANIGMYSLELLKTFNAYNVQIHSFEPSKATFLKMLENTDGVSQIIPNNFGFGDSASKLKLYTNSILSGLASVYQRKLDHFNIQMDHFEEIAITTIDNYCLEKKIKKIDFLKLDVEGHELKVLQGAKTMINDNKIKFIQFEFGGCNIDSRTYFQDFYYLLKDKYKIYRIVRDGLIPILEYKETYEIFTTVNYLVELRED